MDTTTLEGTKVVTFMRREGQGKQIVRYFSGGVENRKLVIEVINDQGDEEALVVRPDGHFSITKQFQDKKGELQTRAFSTRPRDIGIGFLRMTPQATKESVRLVRQFLDSGSIHRPQRPSAN